jgi:hemerythrin-like domain-containing protein
MRMTDALMVEHTALRAVFEQIERVWPRIRTLEEASMLASLVEGLLRQHGSKEENLLFVTYDHVMEERGQLQKMSQEHDEIDQRLLRIRQAATVPEAKRLLRSALSVARRHFRFEELNVFPAIEHALQGDTLERLASRA